MYLKKVIRQNLSFLVLVSFLSIVNSVLFGMIPLLINSTLKKESFLFVDYQHSWVLFGILVVTSFACKSIFQRYMIRFTNAVLFDLELSLLHQLNESDYESFNRLDRTTVYTVISDIKVVSQLPRFFIDSINQTVVIVISFIYLGFVSLLAASLLAGCAICLATYYYLRNRSVARMLAQSRNLENSFFRYVNDLLTGFKGLKLNRPRRNNLYSQFISTNRRAARDLEIDASVVYMNNELLGNYSWFLLLGGIVFLMPSMMHLQPADIISFIVILLYLMAPVSSLINAVPFFTRISIAMKRIGNFIESNRRTLRPVNAADTPVSERVPAETIEFRHVTYAYENSGDERRFSLEGLNLEIQRGETLFITGHNGSGKSTFLMLLVGLIKPQHGYILVNGEPLMDDQAYEWYRNSFAAIFTDSILYSENYDGFDLRPQSETLQDLFRLMHLKGDIISEDKGISTALSKGQQKRLALVYALLEKRDILVFDEWAAEQDPQFRYYFYHTILPELRRLGKTVIAVTHDDKYFHLATRIIEFRDGNISQGSAPASSIPTLDHAQRIWY